MREVTKKRIISIIKAYRILFPDEYRTGAEINKQRAENQKTDWGESVTSAVVEREVLRMPTKLHNILYAKLTPEEISELQDSKGLVWFQRTFPEWVPNRKKE